MKIFYKCIFLILFFQFNQVVAFQAITENSEEIERLLQVGEAALKPYQGKYSYHDIYRYFTKHQPVALNRTISIEEFEFPELIEKLGIVKYINPGLNNYGSCKYDFTLTRLNELVSNLGKEHPYIEIWINNQNAVYENCSSYSKGYVSLPKVPEHIDSEIEDLVKDDVKYQTAAAYYYRGRFDKARERFELLITDNKSRYRGVASYMLAKMELDQNSGNIGEIIGSILNDNSLKEVHRITKQLINILAYRTHDQKLLVKQLEHIQEILLWPTERINKSVLNKNIYQQAKKDVSWFLINNREEKLSLTDDWWLIGKAENYSRAEALMTASVDSEYLDWLQTISAWGSFNAEVPWLGLNYPRVLNASSKNITQHAIKRWKNGNGHHWLLAATRRVHPDAKFSDEVLDQYKKVRRRIRENNWHDDDIVLYPSLFFHAVRILLGRNEDDRAIQMLLDDIDIKNDYRFVTLKNTVLWFIAKGKVDKARYISDSVNINTEGFYYWQLSDLDQLKQLLAEDLYEFLYLDKIQPVGYPRLRPGTLTVLNLLPVKELNKVLDMEFISKADRAEIVRAAWLRAYLLNKTNLLYELTDKLVKFNPYLEKEIEVINSTFFSNNKKNRITKLLLKYPRISTRIDNIEYRWHGPYYKSQDIPQYLQLDVYNHNDNNWWCSYKIGKSYASMVKEFYERVIGLPNSDFYYYANIRPSYLNEDIMEYMEHRDNVLSNHAVLNLIDWEELHALAEITQAPEYLTLSSISAFEDRNILEKYISDETLIQEMLALSVRATRYGCNKDGEHGIYSKRAFEILHYNYPNSEATKNTPYWFN